jgi:hypothetical protein
MFPRPPLHAVRGVPRRGDNGVGIADLPTAGSHGYGCVFDLCLERVRGQALAPLPGVWPPRGQGSTARSEKPSFFVAHDLNQTVVRNRYSGASPRDAAGLFHQRRRPALKYGYEAVMCTERACRAAIVARLPDIEVSAATSRVYMSLWTMSRES